MAFESKEVILLLFRLVLRLDGLDEFERIILTCFICLFLLTANGYIEGTELDGFLAEFVSSVNIMDVGPEVSV